MKLTLFSLLSAGLLFNACAQGTVIEKYEHQKQTHFELKDFLLDNIDLDAAVSKIYASLDDTAIVAQLIMPAVGRLGQAKSTIDQHIQERIIGGVLMLNGTKDEFKAWIADFEQQNIQYGNLPFLYSADAEPSLVNRKILGSKVVKKANEIKTDDEVRECANTISKDLNEIGINYNFAPVVDMSNNTTVGYRGFGAESRNIIPWSTVFITETQTNGIIATAKHFPGHGLVSGDTHKSLQVINGQLKEIENYPPLIAEGLLSIMVAHIAVENNPKYNTNGLPSTCSKSIVTDLLKEQFGFKGLIVTDAMNMGGVVTVPEAALKAIEAGCDIILMPVNAKETHGQILAKYRIDTEFKSQVDLAAKKIIRMKIALGLIDVN